VAHTAARVRVGGPYFEDFGVGQLFEDAPGLTLTFGHSALHQSLLGDRLRLALDADLSRTVTGNENALLHPNLVTDVAIGQSTGPTQRVRGNLFYRGLVLQRPVFRGDTLRTRTEVVALKQNRPKEDGTATGLVALRITTRNQRDQPVLDFWRCAMIPLRDGQAQTGHADSFDQIPDELDPVQVEAAVPDWNFDLYRERVPGEHFSDIEPDTVYEVEGRDTVTAAPELVRLSLNIAQAHIDASSTTHGKRLAYGGHTIGIAAAHATRALPNLITIVAWRSCDHLGPVFEGDVLATEVTVEGTTPLEDAGLVHLRARTRTDETEVLDWRFVGLMA
jgi:acyl dehydratase